MGDQADEARRVRQGPMARAWCEGARVLLVRFVCPFSFEHQGRRHLCTGLLPDFGGPLGALICSRFDRTEDCVYDDADAVGYYASGLSPFHYEQFDRERFVETLNDWGWFGDPAEVPLWFTGRVASPRR